MGRSVKAQMKFANKLGARFSAIIGDSELEAGTVKLKKMDDGSVTEIRLDAKPSDPDSLVQVVYASHLEEIAGALKNSNKRKCDGFEISRNFDRVGQLHYHQLCSFQYGVAVSEQSAFYPVFCI